MHPDSEDRLSQPARKSGSPIIFIIAALLVVAALGFWYLGDSGKQPEPTVPQAAQVPAPPPRPAEELPPAPDIPVREEVVEPEPQAPPEPVLPPVSLETSDAEIRERIGATTQSELAASALANEDLVQRGAALADTLSRGILVHKALPLPKPKGEFSVQESNGALTIDPASYQRYDPYAQAIEEMDTETLVATFHRFRPLLEQAYAELGYDAEDLDNALIRALDGILATPRLETPPEVVKAVKSYKYVDPSLEQRSTLQKQLLRMGPDNVARIQSQARALRTALLAGQ